MRAGESSGLDLSSLPVGALGSGSLLWWGICGLIVVESVVFGTFVSSIFYLRVMRASWPPSGVEAPDGMLASVITLLLLASLFTIRRATTIALREARKPLAMLLLSIGLATISWVLRAVELDGVAFAWNEHAFGSIFWVLNGLHMAHVTAAMLGTGAVAVLVWTHPLGPKVVLATQIDGLYWQFMVVIWMPLYAALYLVPRLS